MAVMAQDTAGVVRYLVTHNWVKKMESLDYLSKDRKERVSYMWGNDAEWKGYGTLYFKGSETKYEDSDEKADKEDDNFSWRRSDYFIYRDFGKRKIFDIIQLVNKTYVIEDTLVPQQWKILNDIKEVAGHICMNASWTDTVKNQKVIAWFAMDIPIDGGPERYCGLPGLILEIDVNNGSMILTADKIEYKDPGEALDKPKKIKGKRITEEDYQKKLLKIIMSF